MAINPPTRVQNGADKTRDSCLSSPDWRPRIRTNLPCLRTGHCGLEEFGKRFDGAATVLVGDGGIPLSEFLSVPAREWLEGR